ncbi:nuclear transport factor 2 family protein [Pseudonocardia sp. NPDC049154]|uniref:nuclear transport factor 2 family protein n=1 Tax=Pseudonocardia sp. NPDC049154 TaxID=3155501 RepID=UPI0033DB30BE
MTPADLYGLYAHHYDEGRAAEFAQLFTDDAPFVTNGVERARGRAAIEEMARTGRASLPGVRHLVSSVAVVVDGDTAAGTAYVQAV